MRSTGPRAIIEAPAGLAAFSLWAHGGPHCRPPISRMGNKAGYAHALGVILGIRAGISAGAFVWAEADADVRGLLRAYPDAAMLRRVADIIRGWKDEEPRALWERLRAERKERVNTEVQTTLDVASWMWVLGHQSMHGSGLAPQYDGIDRGRAWSQVEPTTWLAARCSTLAEYAQLAAPNRLINIGGPALENTGKGGTTFGGEAFATPAGETAAGFERLAGWSIEQAWGSTGQWCGPDRGGACGSHPSGWVGSVTIGGLVARFERGPSGWPPVAVLPSIPTAAELSAMLGTPGDLEGVVVYQDPPYVGTTGYAADLSREEVVRTALDVAAMGARVMVSEAVPVEELTALGWEVTDITGQRKGQKRTFSKTKGEFVTHNFTRTKLFDGEAQVHLFS